VRSGGRITVALFALIAVVVIGALIRDTTRSPASTTSASVASRRPLSALPPEARATWRLIENKGPFRYSKDGTVFENRERLLPSRNSGYYHEYTVPTPGETDRGPRRLVTGKKDELYYTDDHYRSFVVVDPRS
jgi:guanyl-specific ribonuclease Sa